MEEERKEDVVQVEGKEDVEEEGKEDVEEEREEDVEVDGKEDVERRGRRMWRIIGTLSVCLATMWSETCAVGRCV